MNQEKQKMRKTNMRIFPLYKMLAWDYLFFYTIDFLFLTQVKGFSAADVVLKSTFYALFTILMQIPANVIVEFLGRKNSIILGNILNCFYMVILILSHNLGDLIFAEFISCAAFAIKNISEPALLNESIAPSKYKSQTYSKINAKGASGYYICGAISKMIAGFLYTINPYIPIACSLTVLIIVVILSLGFIEPIQKKKRNLNDAVGRKQLTDLKDGFIYVLKSERLKALILSSAGIASLLSILINYYVSLLEDLKLSAVVIGTVSAVGSVLASYASKKQNKIQEKLKNKTLTSIAIALSISTIIAGIFGIMEENIIIIAIIIVILMNLIYHIVNGIYCTINEQYLRNFTNEKIDTKIFAIERLFRGIARTIAGLFATFLIDKFETSYCMIIIGIGFTIIYILVGKYMSKRVGLKPEEYSKEETKYDEQIKITN
ncbi:MAG: MFS transporter [Clostridia bacterium]|nr:MFS transporter [Clostridia bacterium]